MKKFKAGSPRLILVPKLRLGMQIFVHSSRCGIFLGHMHYQAELGNEGSAGIQLLTNHKLNE
ncbi:MAG TPA: hypothetical protein DIW64_21085 [Cellvibrio sp.]|nr:hypothetical protein [Cellvibrio sp.]